MRSEVLFGAQRDLVAAVDQLVRDLSGWQADMHSAEHVIDNSLRNAETTLDALRAKWRAYTNATPGD